MARVELNAITKIFPGGTVAVDGVTMDVADGEFVVLVGPSGCGKSTVLRMVAGLEDITSGTVSIDGEVVNYLPPKQRDIAMVFQNYALYPHMTVGENLSFSLRIAHRPKTEIAAHVDDVSHVLGLQQLLSRRPAALSGGQRQRVAMGRAIVRSPRVFLMDEPLSNLDAKLRVAMRAELTRLHHRFRTTTLYVTHDQVEAMTLGDRIAVLDRGRLQQVGTPQELYDAPRNVFVAGLHRLTRHEPRLGNSSIEHEGGGRVGHSRTDVGRCRPRRSLVSPTSGRAWVPEVVFGLGHTTCC